MRFLERVTPLREVAGGVVSHVDITRRKQAEFKLSEIASRDALTGLWNRHAIERIGPAEPAGPAVLFIDLAGFKAVNDTFGYATGDSVLARAANRILHQTRAADRVARVGGDEFVVILGDDRNEEWVGASVPIAYGAPGEAVADVVARADRNARGATGPPGRGPGRWAGDAAAGSRWDGRHRRPASPSRRPALSSPAGALAGVVGRPAVH